MNTPAYFPDTDRPQSLVGFEDLPTNPGSSHAEPSPEDGTIRYFCSICHKGYTQRQGTWRHIRTVHNPNLCLYCGFTWARPYEYKNHLIKKHPGINPDVTPGKAPGSRCSATVLTERLPQQSPVSPPAVGQGQQNWAGFQPYPSALPPNRARDTDAFRVPPAVSSVNYNSPRVYAEPTVTMYEREYTHGSAMLLSNISLPGSQIGLLSAHPGATRTPSNPETAPILSLSPFAVEIPGAIVSEHPVVVPYRPTRYTPSSNADHNRQITQSFDMV